MKKISPCLFALVVALHVSAFGQNPFVNLDFEQGQMIPLVSSPNYPLAIAATDALPGWTIIHDFGANQVLHNTVSFSSALVSIHDASDSFADLYGGPISGYTVLLQPRFRSLSTVAAISQFGDLPGDTQSLRFAANGPISVSIDGQLLPVVTLDIGPNYAIYGSDISSYAGQSHLLRFEANTFSPSGWGSSLDNISFSPQAVPEPSSLALLAIGAVALVRIRLRRRR